MSTKELISRYHRRPALYILGSPGSTDWLGIQKIGTSASIPFRKNNWKTCSIYPVKFQHVFFLDPAAFQTISELVELDEVVLPMWLKLRQEWDTSHIYLGGGTEFYRFQDPVTTLRTFLEEHRIRIVEELSTDPFPFPCSPSKEHEQDLDKENAERPVIIQGPKCSALSKQRFLHLLKFAGLRRNQDELWGIWETLLKTSESYKGIVHWPTGTGKTVGMLILIIILHQHLAAKGEIYRGILVAPQNNILDTLIKHIRLLRHWGIEVLEGHNASFNKLSIPNTKPFLLVTTHAALADKEAWKRFPSLNHIHYDEVHKITGEQFYDGVMQSIATWNIPYITGTSATPKTSDPEQHEKLSRLFGNGPPLHCVTVEEAVQEGWIAKPHFLATSLEGNAIQGFLQEIHNFLQSHKLRCGKVIVYLEEKAMVREALRLSATWPYKRYHALGSEEDVGSFGIVGTDEEFVAANPTGEPQLLFACQRYREGSDISGVDFVAFLMGRTTSAHIIAQIVGRAMRMDYPGKVATCLLARIRQEGETDDAVLESVHLTLERMYPTSYGKMSKKQSKHLWGLEYKTHGAWITQEESLLRLQNWYMRKEYSSRDLDLNGFKKLIENNALNPLDQTCETLRHYGYFPENIHASWGLSYYNAVEAIVPGSTSAIRAWGCYPDAFHVFLKENHIADVFDYETRWKTLVKEGHGIPGMPKDLWGENFWHEYATKFDEN